MLESYLISDIKKVATQYAIDNNLNNLNVLTGLHFQTPIIRIDDLYWAFRINHVETRLSRDYTTPYHILNIAFTYKYAYGLPNKVLKPIIEHLCEYYKTDEYINKLPDLQIETRYTSEYMTDQYLVNGKLMSEIKIYY